MAGGVHRLGGWNTGRADLEPGVAVKSALVYGIWVQDGQVAVDRFPVASCIPPVGYN